MSEAAKFGPETHYHAPTLTLFTLAHCAFCKGAVCTDRIQATKMPNGVKVWGDKTLPAIPKANAYAAEPAIVCSRCEGKPFYLEDVKSEWAVVKRATGELAGTKKTEKAARELCDSMNKAVLDDYSRSLEQLAEPDSLTLPVDASKLGPVVVIRLAGDLPNGMKRGDHLELPIAKLISLINETGVTTMTKAATRSTAKELIRSLIVKKKTDAEILEAVHKQFPESSADSKHCTKYRRELFTEEVIGADLAAVGSREHREWAASNMAAAKKGPHAEYWKKQGEAKTPVKAPVKAAAKPVKAAAKPAAKPLAAAKKDTKAPAKAAKPAAKPAAKKPVAKPAAGKKGGNKDDLALA